MNASLYLVYKYVYSLYGHGSGSYLYRRTMPATPTVPHRTVFCPAPRRILAHLLAAAVVFLFALSPARANGDGSVDDHTHSSALHRRRLADYTGQALGVFIVQLPGHYMSLTVHVDTGNTLAISGVVDAAGEFPVFEAPNNGSNRHRHFVVKVGGTLSLERLTMKKGSTTIQFSGGSSGPDNRGGSIYAMGIVNLASIFYDGCTVPTGSGNQECAIYGGAIAAEGVDSSLSIRDSTFRACTASWNGGAILVLDIKRLDITNTLFQGNKVARALAALHEVQGSAIMIQGTSSVFLRGGKNNFTNNFHANSQFDKTIAKAAAALLALERRRQ